MPFFDPKLPDKLKLEDSIAKLEEIQAGFKQNRANLHQIIKMLESKPELQNEIEFLEKDVESRAICLEDEVKQLQEELKSIRELLGMNLGKYNSDKT